jgi:hypothetical protein
MWGTEWGAAEVPPTALPAAPVGGDWGAVPGMHWIV